MMMVKNSTGGRLELWEQETLIANLPHGASIDSLRAGVTRVICGESHYSTRRGEFLPQGAYLATFIAARLDRPAMVLFSGTKNSVSFT
jgi:hypothetical protein